MNLAEWMNIQLTGVVGLLEKSILKAYTEGGLNLACRHDIYEVLDNLLAALFPGYHSAEKISPGEMNFFLNDMLRHSSFKLCKHIKGAFHYHCLQDTCASHHGTLAESCNCEERADQALIHLIESLPCIHAVLLEDIRAAYEGDPAAKCIDEIILSYPCIEAIATYRIAHQLYELDVPIIPRIMSERAHSRTGIDIHPGARIAPGFFIDHGTGVVIGETCTIGRNVKVYQGVTLGALSPFDQKGVPLRGVKRHPDVEDDVIIYANATILGGETVIGQGAVIGGNTWIIKSVPPGAHVYNRSREEIVEPKTPPS
ncbi:MAG: serine O-acetyltransferase EpsC [bacterium]